MEKLENYAQELKQIYLQELDNELAHEEEAAIQAPPTKLSNLAKKNTQLQEKPALKTAINEPKESKEKDEKAGEGTVEPEDNFAKGANETAKAALGEVNQE